MNSMSTGSEATSSIVRAKEEHCWGAPGENPWGDQFSFGELHHDVGEIEENRTQVILYWSVTQKCAELLLHAPVIDGGSLGVWGRQLPACPAIVHARS